MNKYPHACEYLEYRSQRIELVYPGTEFQRAALMQTDRSDAPGRVLLQVVFFCPFCATDFRAECHWQILGRPGENDILNRARLAGDDELFLRVSRKEIERMSAEVASIYKNRPGHTHVDVAFGAAEVAVVKDVVRMSVEATMVRKTAEHLRDKLISAGLFCDGVLGGDQVRVRGGTSLFIASGVSGFEHPFAVIGIPGRYEVSVMATRGFGDVEAVVSTIVEAAELVVSTYRTRKLLSSDR